MAHGIMFNDSKEYVPGSKVSQCKYAAAAVTAAVVVVIVVFILAGLRFYGVFLYSFPPRRILLTGYNLLSGMIT